MGVADEGDALAALGESTGLLHGQNVLPLPASTAHFDAVEEADGVEDHGLGVRSRVRRVLVRQGAGDDAGRCGKPALPEMECR